MPEAIHEPAPRATLSKTYVVVAAALLLLFFAQIVHIAKTDSVNWDESQHLYSGVLSWKHADFGYNPEVPPLVKMWCAIPLLHRNLTEPPYTGEEFKQEGFVLGQRFLHVNGIDETLIPARMMAALLSALLAVMVFVTALEMFGEKAALFSLALLCFDPNILAHGSYVTTDIGASLTVLLATYSFYRVLKRPSLDRIVILGVAIGLAFTAKFTGIFIVPIIFAISVLDLWSGRYGQTGTPKTSERSRLATAIVVSSFIGYGFIWMIYRFRFAARPAGLVLNPATGQFLQGLTPFARSVMLWFAKHHLFPEAYLYGLADTKISAPSIPSYLFGHLSHGASRWYYPAAFSIKSTLPFLILLAVALFVIISRRWKIQREGIVLLVPVGVLFLIACTSEIGIGYRHLMPIFPLLYILIGGCAAYLVSTNKKLIYLFGVLLLWQVIEPSIARPGLVTYANEAWGGPAKTHLYLADSNVDWGQQLKAVKKYLDAHAGKTCYFAYSEQGPVDYRDYGINCQVLPTGVVSWMGMDSMRFGSNPMISGLLLISDGEVAGVDIPGNANPYAGFKSVQPTAVIDRGVYVYDGRFSLGPVAALEHVQAAGELLKSGQAERALAEARMAVDLDAASASGWKVVGDALGVLGKADDARAAYEQALKAPELDPVFQPELVAELKKKLGR